ncbi:hypothetical protein K1T71_014589 [Dendrolimus kikuchii]|uniref:Uncharacterized protein n=1 Tax=Dendrolimus kikuchii TaxID=765133 RepID=A0ACC1CEF8_9NEOP|nr:hypothetical protein K1T71_014589 [Dendrolimus kikuchii]
MASHNTRSKTKKFTEEATQGMEPSDTLAVTPTRNFTHVTDGVHTPFEQRDDATDHAFSSQAAESNMTFSHENVAAIISSLQRSQIEALKELRSSITRANASTPIPQVTAEGTLTRCKATFSGNPDENVEAFIEALEAYNECAQNESTDIFVSRIRALFAKLPNGVLNEIFMLDVTYGLLSCRIREKLRRIDFQTFAELLYHVRNAEDAILPRMSQVPTTRALHVPSAAPDAPSAPAPAPKPAPPPQTTKQHVAPTTPSTSFDSEPAPPRNPGIDRFVHNVKGMEIQGSSAVNY